MINRQIIIFEGPDGSGKTTAAKALAVLIQAEYAHHGPYIHSTGDSICYHYIDSMTPALIDVNDVVLDRSWLSERPYGIAYRGGIDRLGAARKASLEALAKIARPVVILCLPPWEVVERNFQARTKDEMLRDTKQLQLVYNEYKNEIYSDTTLEVIKFDYTTESLMEVLSALQEM